MVGAFWYVQTLSFEFEAKQCKLEVPIITAQRGRSESCFIL
jgi:hypothetical protein